MSEKIDSESGDVGGQYNGGEGCGTCYQARSG